MKDLQVEIGDIIECKDIEALMEVHKHLQEEGYETDFVYLLGGKKGCWLEITGYSEESRGENNV